MEFIAANDLGFERYKTISTATPKTLVVESVWSVLEALKLVAAGERHNNKVNEAAKAVLLDATIKVALNCNNKLSTSTSAELRSQLDVKVSSHHDGVVLFSLVAEAATSSDGRVSSTVQFLETTLTDVSSAKTSASILTPDAPNKNLNSPVANYGSASDTQTQPSAGHMSEFSIDSGEEVTEFMREEQLKREKIRFRLSCGVVLFIWILLVPAGIFGAIKLFDKLTFAKFETKDDTILGKSKSYHWYNQNLFELNPVYLTIQSTEPGKSAVTGERGQILEYLTREKIMPKLVETFGTVDPNSGQLRWNWPFGGISGYFLPGYRNETLVAGKNNDTTVLMLNWQTQESKPYTADIERFLDEHRDAYDKYFTVTVSGMPQLMSAMKDTVLANMGVIDAICIPLGFVLFAMCIGTSPTTLLVPLITLPASLTIGLGASSPLHNSMNITAFAPEIMLSVVIALTMDFALFLLSRIKEQLKEDRVRLLELGLIQHADEVDFDLPRLISLTRPKGDTVKICLKHVSHNIAVSGTAVTLAFGALGFIKEDFVRSCALVSAIGAATTTLISLTLLPAVTYLMFNILFINVMKKCAQQKPPATLENSGALDNNNAAVTVAADGDENPALIGGHNGGAAGTRDSDKPLLDYEDGNVTKPSPHQNNHKTASASSWLQKLWNVAKAADIPETNMWGKMATFSSHNPIVVLVPVLTIFAIFLYVILTGFTTDLSSFATCPHNIKYWDNYHQSQDLFKTKTMAPYYVVFAKVEPYTGGDANLARGSVLDYEYWKGQEAAVELLMDKKYHANMELGLEEITAPCIWNGEIISYNRSVQLQQWAEFGAYNSSNTTEGLAYVDMLKTTWSELQAPALVAITLRPKGKFTSSWGGYAANYMEYLQSFAQSDELKKRLAAANAPNNTFVGYYGPNAAAWSVMRRVMSEFDLLIGITFGVLTLAIVVLFRSVVIALRMVITMTMTVVFSFGSVTFLMHYGYFAPVWPALKYIEGYYWIIPVLAFSIVCVVSLDYDVFLVTRIIEIRSKTTPSEELDAFFATHKDGRYSHDSACVISAVSRTGPVISWAAAIMTMAFGMLAFSNTVMMAQYGLTIALAVVYDAFIVRPLVVPAVMALLPGSVIWFPRRFEEVISPLRPPETANVKCWCC